MPSTSRLAPFGGGAAPSRGGGRAPEPKQPWQQQDRRAHGGRCDDDGGQRLHERVAQGRRQRANAGGGEAGGCEPGSAPRPGAPASATAAMTRLRTSLSASPNRSTTNCLAPGGWSAMTRSPTATTRLLPPGSRPATNSEIPRAAAAATPP